MLLLLNHTITITLYIPFSVLDKEIHLLMLSYHFVSRTKAKDFHSIRVHVSPDEVDKRVPYFSLLYIHESQGLLGWPINSFGNSYVSRHINSRRR
jgi:hypothetical protein